MLVVRRVHVGDVQEAVAADAEVHERGLDARLDVDDPALVDVADVALLAGPLDVEFFQHAVLDDGDPALLRLEDVDQHFFLHGSRVALGRLGPFGSARPVNRRSHEREARVTPPPGRRATPQPAAAGCSSSVRPAAATAAGSSGRVSAGPSGGRPPGPGSAISSRIRRSVRSSTAPASSRSRQAEQLQQFVGAGGAGLRDPEVECQCELAVRDRCERLARRSRRYGRMFSRFGLGRRRSTQTFGSAISSRAARGRRVATRSGGSGER